MFKRNERKSLWPNHPIRYSSRRRINPASIRRFRNGVKTLDCKVPEPIFPGLERGLIGRKPYSSGIQLCNAEELVDKIALNKGLISDKTYKARQIARVNK